MNRTSKHSSKYATNRAKRVVRVMLAIALLLIFLHFVFQYINMNVFYQQNGQFYELSNRFDLDDESSVSTWYSQVLLLATGIGALLIAFLTKNKVTKKLWNTIGAIGILFSLDEIAGLHERFLQSVHVLLFQDNAPTGFANAWLVLLPAILLVAGWLAYHMLRLLPKETTMLFVFGGIIFLLGSVGIDLITPTIDRETFLQQGVFVGLEETFELIGTIVAFYAVARHLEINHNKELSEAYRALS